MKNIVDLMKKVNGATFISIDSSTEPRLTGGKKNPHIGRVRKVTEGASVMVFQNKTTNAYENMVNKRLGKEGKSTFTLSPRTWGTRVPNLPFVEHKGSHYMEVIFLSSGDTTYTLDGVPTPATDIIGLAPKPDEAAQGGLNDKVIIRTFKVANINKITIDKETHTNLFFDI